MEPLIETLLVMTGCLVALTVLGCCAVALIRTANRMGRN